MSRSESHRRLAVILHADVAGSTTLIRTDEQRAHLRIRDAFDQLTRTVHGYGGNVREIRGDALVA